MKFSGELRFPEIDHPGVPVLFVIEGPQAELVVEGESLGKWSLFDVQAHRLVASAFQIDLDGTEVTFVAADPIDFAYRGVDHMAQTWASMKTKRLALRTIAVRKSRQGTTPSRIDDLRAAMEANLEAVAPKPLAGEPSMPTQIEALEVVTPAVPLEDWDKRDQVGAIPMVGEPAAADEPVEVPEQGLPPGPADQGLSEEQLWLEEEKRRIAEERARLEEERLAAEQREANLLEAYRLEMERLEAERAEIRRQAAEEAELALTQRHAVEQAARETQEREAAERAAEEAERVAAEHAAREAAERASAERLAAEEAARVAEERAAAELAEAERVAAAQAHRERAEREAAQRAAAEEAERVAASAESGSTDPDGADIDESAIVAGRELFRRRNVLDLSDLEKDRGPEPGPSVRAPRPEPAPQPEPALAGAPKDKGGGLMGAVKAAFRGGVKDHDHQFVEAPGGIGITRYVCEECGYVSISVGS